MDEARYHLLRLVVDDEGIGRMSEVSKREVARTRIEDRVVVESKENMNFWRDMKNEGERKGPVLQREGLPARVEVRSQDTRRPNSPIDIRILQTLP